MEEKIIAQSGSCKSINCIDCPVQKDECNVWGSRNVIIDDEDPMFVENLEKWIKIKLELD